MGGRGNVTHQLHREVPVVWHGGQQGINIIISVFAGLTRTLVQFGARW